MTKRSGSDWWQLDHDDFWTSELVLQMPDAAKAVYAFLLGLQAKNGALPRDAKLVGALLFGFTERSWREFAPFLDRAFPVDAADGKRRNAKQAAKLARIDADRERERARKSDARRAGSPPDVHRTSEGRPAAVRAERRGEKNGEEKDNLGSQGLAASASTNGHAPPRVDEIPISGRIAVHVPVESALGRLALHWLAEWARTRSGAAYTLVEIDVGAFARALRLANGDLDDAKRRATALLESRDAFEVKKASPEWLARSDVWSRLGGDIARAQSKRSATPPSDACSVSDWWHEKHRKISKILAHGHEYEVASTDVPYPGYAAAKAEMLAARAQTNGQQTGAVATG